MSCYFRHIEDILDEAGIEVNPSSKKRIDAAIHQIVGVTYKDCPATWKRLKQQLIDNEQKRKSLVKELQDALH